MKTNNVAYVALGLSVVALGFALMQRRALKSILGSSNSSFSGGDDTLDAAGPIVQKNNLIAAKTKKTWINPKGTLCPPGVRAVRNADGTWTCISSQRSKCPSGYDILYSPGTNTPKGCVNLATGKEIPLQS
jgi:hypothetical protein